MKKNTKYKALIIAAALIGIVASGVLGAEMWLRHTIRDAVERALSGTGATVEFGRISVSLPRRSVSVRNVRVRAHNNDVAHRGFTVVSLDVTIPRITARSVGYKRVRGRSGLKADRLAVETPVVTLVTRNAGSALPAGDTLPAPKKFHETLSEKHSLLEIGEVSIIDAAFEHTRWLSDSENTRMMLGGGNLSVKGITLDSLPAGVHFAADSVIYDLVGRAQVLKADSMVLDVSAGTFSLAGFALVPQFGKDEFAERTENHEDWTAIAIEDIYCSGVDYGRLLAEKTLAVDSVSLAAADIASYKNRKVFQQPRAKQMLYQAIQRLPVPLYINVLVFENLDVRYDELSERGDAPGVVILTDGMGTAKNLTNIPVGHDRFITIDISAAFMDSGDLEARFLFPVAADDDHWELSGRLGSMHMSVLNRAIEPLMAAKITSGEIESLDFHIAGTLAESHSKITMAYNDLQLAFLDRRDHTRERRFLTFLADDLLIRPDNPGRDSRGRLREGEGGHKRDVERSMWNYIWHSLLPAIIRTIV